MCLLLFYGNFVVPVTDYIVVAVVVFIIIVVPTKPLLTMSLTKSVPKYVKPSEPIKLASVCFKMVPNST